MNVHTLTPLIAYAIFTIWRVSFTRKRLNLPVFRGPGYFFNLQVPADFYSGVGRGVLRKYRAALLVPYAIEWTLAVAFISTQRYGYLFWLILTGSIVANTAMGVAIKVLMKSVRGMDSIIAPPQVSKLAISLQQRTLASYSRPAVEIALAAATLLSAGLLFWSFPRSGESAAYFFVAPLLAFYAQLGVLLIKDTVIRQPMKVPSDAAEEYESLLQKVRWYRATLCDWIRAECTGLLLGFSLMGPCESRWGFAGRFVALAPVMAILAAFMIATRRGMVRVLRAAAVVRPLDMSRVASRRGNADRFLLGGLLYFDRENPLLLVRGPLWFTFNLANARAYAFAAWFGGLIAIALWRGLQ